MLFAAGSLCAGAETVALGDAGDFSYHARFALEGRGPHTMSLSWHNTADSTLYAVIAEVPAGSDDPLFPSRCRYTAGSVRGDSISIDADGVFTATIGKKPAFTMVLRRTAGGTAVSFGSSRPEASVEVPFHADSIRTEARQGTSLLRHSLIVRYRRTSEKSQFDTEEKISAHLASSADPMEAEWTYLDRDLSASKARLGGRYRLATISNGEGYDIIYIAGAQAGWNIGDIKGRLSTTPFQDHYDLEWFSTERRSADTEACADIITDGLILELTFPALQSKVRFRRISR